MSPIEPIKLSEVLGLVPKPMYVLGTTYTLSLAFFESVVFPEFNRSRLKSCLIICGSPAYHNAIAGGKNCNPLNSRAAGISHPASGPPASLQPDFPSNLPS